VTGIATEALGAIAKILPVVLPLIGALFPFPDPKGPGIMPTFDALQVVEPLKVNFNPYLNLEGTIPEPSEAQLSKFFEAMIKVSESASEAAGSLAGITDPAQLATAMAKLPDGSLAGMLTLMNKPYADLCSGFPSEEQISKLPPRVRLAFFGWLGGELNPEASGGASSPAPQTAS
jgi:hypothetical protein